MENNKHHIDQFLQEQMEHLPVEFNEAHWKDAERRLDEEDKRKRPFFLLFLGLAVLLGIGTVAYNKLTHKAQNPSQAKLAQMHTNQSNIDQPASVDPQNSDDYGIDQGIPASQNEASESRSVNTLNTNGVETPFSNQQNKVSTAQQTNPDVRNSVSGPTATNKLQPTASRHPNTNPNNVNAIASNGTPTQSKSSAMTTEAQLGEPQRATDGIKTLNSKKAQADGDTNSPEQYRSTTGMARTSDLLDPVDRQDANTEALAVGPSVPKKKIRIYKTLAEYQALNPRYVEGLEHYNYVKSTIPLSVRKSDSIRNIVAKQEAPQPKVKQKSSGNQQVFVQQPSSLFMLAGFGMARGYEGINGNPAVYSFSPSLGAGYQLNFSDRMSLYLSAYMNYISHLNIRDTATNITYSFDKDSSLISITRKNLMQLQIPIQLAYKLTPKHSIYGGLGINLGLNSISIYKDSKQSSSQRRFGYMDGIRFMDVNANFGYEYNVTPNLSLGLFYQQGFFDMTKNDYFNNSNTDKNSRGGVRLRYKFIGR